MICRSAELLCWLCLSENIYNVIIFSFLNPARFFSVQFPMNSQQKVRQLGRITCAVINTSNEVQCLLLWEFLIYNFSRRSLERVFVGSIENIRNECLFFWVHGEWIVARNKQIAREPLRVSRYLFVPRHDLFSVNPEKKTLIPWLTRKFSHVSTKVIWYHCKYMKLNQCIDIWLSFNMCKYYAQFRQQTYQKQSFFLIRNIHFHW